MSFVHEHRDFDALVRIVAGKRGLSLTLVEKDYWVTHTLWALLESGFEVWLKGGTSLSKGFELIERFSEDLDLKVEPGRVAGVPPVANWTSEGSSATASGSRAFEIPSTSRGDAIRAAFEAIGPMFWGERVSLDEACKTIREWVRTTLE